MNNMEPARRAEHSLEVFADPSCVKDVVKAILHTIFFHRYFIPVTPKTRDLLDTTLPAVDDNDLETDIDQQAHALTQTLQSSSANTTAASNGTPYSAHHHNISRPSTHAHTPSPTYTNGIPSQNHRASIVVQFLEKKRRKSYFTFGKADEDIVWEQWTLDVTTATPRTDTEVAKVRRAMEKSLHKSALRIIDIVNSNVEHIPPIVNTEANPFPYRIMVNPVRGEAGYGGGRITLF